jgi:hypothetical protein
MAPRRTIRTSPLVPSTDNQPTPTPPVQHSGARLQARVEEGEDFNLDDISGGDESDDEEADDPPVNRAHTQEIRSMATHKTQINDPGPIPAPNDESKKPAADTWYFFNKSADVGKAICNVCRYVSPHSPLSDSPLAQTVQGSEGCQPWYLDSGQLSIFAQHFYHDPPGPYQETPS